MVTEPSVGARATGGKQIDMYRFKQMLVEPYYCGVLKMSNWPVNEHGLHEPMLTLKEHDRLVIMVEGKGKKFVPQRHNPEFQLSNLMECTDCVAAAFDKPRMVGYRHNNGKQGRSHKEYMRYRCRTCGRNILRVDLHEALDRVLDSSVLTPAAEQKLKTSSTQGIGSDGKRPDTTSTDLRRPFSVSPRQEESAGYRYGGSSPDLMKDYAESLAAIKFANRDTEDKLAVASDFEQDFIEFVEFALGYIAEWKKNWWTLGYEEMDRCKQILFRPNLV